jgi:outer membrane protein OmpA-like peptidoglycan-associated protein
MKMVSTFLMACGLLSAQAAQAPNPTEHLNMTEKAMSRVPIYKVTVVARTTKAINYNHRSGSTNIDFRGTALMPDASGEAKVESKQGVINIDAHMKKMKPATNYGPEYLTYVMWAITPEGRATNVGEVLLNGDNSKLNATTELQSFGLIVTAEPYFAVTQPSDVVVMENFVRHDTTGTIEEVDAKYELLQRGQYVLNVNPSDIKSLGLDRRVPLELYEARNAVQIARAAGAQQYASDTYLKAVQGLENAESFLKGKAGKKPIGTVAREAIQMAEDARIITVKKIMEEQLANERQAGADREADSEKARVSAQAETERVAQQANASRVTAQNEADRVKLETDAQQANAQAETEKARVAAQQADQGRLKAEAEKTELRAQLLQQFNLILETRDTPRGLVVNMSDVLFDTGKYSLRPAAREKLAKVGGIIMGHPGLRLDVEGYTDSIGGDEYNQKLSEQRGGSVRDYLTQEGIASASIASKGFGKGQPVASNDTAEGRQRNRRVELVISGEIIGTVIGTPVASR